MVVVGWAFVAVVAGCSTTGEASPPASQEMDVPDFGELATDVILHPSFTGDFRSNRAFVVQQRRGIAETCLGESGYRFPLSDQVLADDLPVTPVDQQQSIRSMREWVASYGYGIVSEWVAPEDAPVEDLSAPELDARNRCLQLAMEQVSWPAGPGAASAAGSSDVDAVVDAAATDIANDPEWAIATAGWSSCMKSAGYDAVDHEGLVEELNDRASNGDLAQQDEIAVATEDFECWFDTVFVPQRRIEVDWNDKYGLSSAR